MPMLQSLKGKLTRSGRDLATDTLAPGQEPIHDAAATDIVGSLSLLTVNETVHERITEQTISELEVKEPMANTDGQEPSTSPVHSPRLRFKEILKTFTRKDTVVTATATAGPAQDHSSITAAVTQGSVVHRDNNDHDSDSDSFGKDFDDIEYDENDEDLSDDEILTTPCCDEVDVVTVAFNVPSGPSGSKSKTPYPATINAKFVKLQSLHQNVDGLRHALYAAIQKSSAIKEVGRLFDGGIYTSANHKRWYHSTLPMNWIQKLTSDHHFGNYVVTNRKSGVSAWEDMPIYARIGMHLLFACVIDHRLLNTDRIRHLFYKGSVRQGKHFDAPESVSQIPYFIKTYKIDLSELLQPDITQYKSFNDFFYRKLRSDVRPIYEKENPNTIVSSADCRLCVFESITAATQVWIKGKSFSIQQLVRDPDLATEFEGGSIALFRLAPQDYHRFHSPVQGTVVTDAVKIDGTYFTVNPMAVNHNVDVFTENVRKVTIIGLDQSQDEHRNEQFDKCVFVSIGALLVGSIVLTGAQEQGTKILKGDELGYFAYGGSTCIVLFKKDAVQFDQDLLNTSLKGLETLVKVGERIGARK